MGTFAPYVLSILRIVAALFLQHGLSKVFSFPVPGSPLHGLLLLVAFLETVGSLLLLVGAYSRIVAFILSGETAFAYFMGHAPRSFYPIANQGEVLFCFIFLYIAFAGGGPWSVDRGAEAGLATGRKRRRRADPTPFSMLCALRLRRRRGRRSQRLGSDRRDRRRRAFRGRN